MFFSFNGQAVQNPNDILMQEASETCRTHQCDDCPLVEGLVRDYGSIICETGRYNKEKKQ